MVRRILRYFFVHPDKKRQKNRSDPPPLGLVYSICVSFYLVRAFLLIYAIDWELGFPLLLLGAESCLFREPSTHDEVEDRPLCYCVPYVFNVSMLKL